jgi:hypothetical protein
MVETPSPMIDLSKPGSLKKLCPTILLITIWCPICPSTTYGENIGVLAITKIYSVYVIGGAAVIAIIF